MGVVSISSIPLGLYRLCSQLEAGSNHFCDSEEFNVLVWHPNQAESNRHSSAAFPARDIHSRYTERLNYE